MGQIICWNCLAIAEPVAWSKTVELLECPECRKIWETAHHQRLWTKYQVDGKKPSKGHLTKVFEG